MAAATSPRPTTSRLLRRLPLPAAALVAWTLFVWVGRIRNVAADETLAGWSAAWRLALALTFIVGAAGVAIAAVAKPTWVVPAARALAVLGIIVWAIRGVDIAIGDHSAAFIAVHLVLAVVTIGLGALVLRLRPSPARDRKPGHRGRSDILR